MHDKTLGRNPRLCRAKSWGKFMVDCAGQNPRANPWWIVQDKRQNHAGQNPRANPSRL